MPTLDKTLKDSQTRFTTEMPNTLNGIKNLDEYETALSETTFAINKNSNAADIVIEHAMAKNIAIQETQDFLEEYIPTKNRYSRDKEIREYDLYKDIDTSFDRYTAGEIKQRRNLLARFTTKIQEEEPQFQDRMIQ